MMRPNKTLCECFTRLAVTSQHPLRYNGIYKYSTSIQNAKPFKSIPGLPSLPYLGPLHNFLPFIGEIGPNVNIFSLAGILHNKYGPIVRMNGILGRADIVILFDPVYKDQVFRAQESNPIRPTFDTMQYYRETMREDALDGAYGLTSTQGPRWREFRKKVNPSMLSLKLDRVYTSVFEEIADEFLERLHKLKDNKAHLTDKFLVEVNKWTLESVAYVALGSRLDCIKDELPLEHPASKLTKCAGDIVILSLLLEYIPKPWRYIRVPGFKKLMKTYDTQWEYNGIYKYSTSIQNAKPFKSIPGLPSLPYLGPLHNFLPFIGEIGPNVNIFSLAGILHNKYGPIVRMNGILGRADIVILFDPVYIDQVFRAQESNPIRPTFDTMQYYRETMREDALDGAYGLTSTQGPRWREFRKKVNPSMLSLKLDRVYTSVFEEIADEFLERLHKLKDNKAHLTDKFLVEVNKWTLESVAYVALGSRLDCIKDELPLEHPASKLTKCAGDIVILSLLLEYIPNPWRYIRVPGFKKLMKTYDTQWEICSSLIGQAKQRINDRGHDIPDEEKTIIEKLLAIDERVTVMAAIEMLLAGVDTVGLTTVGLLYHLGNNQEIQEKLRQELRSDNPQKRYLRACVKEALRIWHVAPPNTRRTDKDHVVGGYHIPSGVDVIAPNEYLSKLEKYFPRPNEFLPERWLAEKGDPLYYGNAHAMTALPFGFGVRSCIGRRIAELEIEILMKKLIDQFKITWEGPPVESITLNRKFHFKFEAAT